MNFDEGLTMLFLLFAGHFASDFPFQDAHMARTKNRHNKPEPGDIPPGQKITPIWYYSLTAHAFIHGTATYVATYFATGGDMHAAIFMGLWQAWCHWFIDFLKCENVFGPHLDQRLHYAVLLVIWALVFGGYV